MAFGEGRLILRIHPGASIQKQCILYMTVGKGSFFLLLLLSLFFFFHVCMCVEGFSNSRRVRMSKVYFIELRGISVQIDEN